MSSILDNDDGINSLPDNVLCHMLTFLKTSEVRATSVLSKRWRYLWRSVPAFIFHDLPYVHSLENDCRMNYLAYTFLLSVNYIKICKLNLWYNDADVGHLSFLNIIYWINAVVERRVEYIELCIQVSLDDSMKLPISILTCPTLVVLRLFGFIVKDFSSIKLPSLKTLRMDEITFLNVQDFILLLAGCPNLEDLSARYSVFLAEEFLTYQERESLTLSKLTKADLAGTFCHFPLKALRNVEHLSLHLDMVCRDWGEIPTFHNLTNLKLYLENYNWNLSVPVLKRCPNLQNVELRQDQTHDEQANWEDPIFVPPCLSLKLKTCKYLWFYGDEGEYQFARYILKNARVLQTMTIHCSKNYQIDEELYLYPKASPMCEVIVERNKFI